MLQACPDVYFAANQPKFQTKVFKGKKDFIITPGYQQGSGAFVVTQSQERNDLSGHYGVCACVGKVACLLVATYEIFLVSKVSWDFKNSKAKMCFTTFWATLISGTPFSLELRSLQIHFRTFFISSSCSSSQSSFPHCFISSCVFNLCILIHLSLNLPN